MYIYIYISIYIYIYVSIYIYIYVYTHACESKIGSGSLRGDPYYGSGRRGTWDVHCGARAVAVYVHCGARADVSV